MSSVGEAATQSTQVHAALNAGINTVSDFQTVTFNQYVRLILPLDGSVFWVLSSLLVDTMLFSAYRFNAAALRQVTTSAFAAKQIVASNCDLHYSTQNTQGEENADVINKVVVTSATPIEGLQDVGPYVMYIAEIDGIKFSFSAQGFLQQNADIYHYTGTALLASMGTQIVSTPNELNADQVVVSNSLPLFIAMNYYVPKVYETFGNTTLPIYPSYLIPNDLPPPFAAVHIDPNQTIALGSAPRLDNVNTHTQLAKDHVKITVYGQRNDDAQDLMDFIYQQALNQDTFGMMGMPILRDEKKTQVEFGTLAIKKSFEFDISYYQTRVRNIARQLIENAPVTYLVNPL